MTRTDPAVRLSERGSTECRGCGALGLDSILDLGEQPLANELLRSPDQPEGRYPLHLRICPVCGLGQVGEFVLPETIFGDYPYLSSMSRTWVEHARRYAADRVADLGLGADSLVVEIASNDGCFLREFQSLGVAVLGVEPARNVAGIARAAGVETIPEFFGADLARRIRRSGRAPSLVVANNVMAHVPDLEDFIGGLAILADPRTVITVENPSMLNLLLGGQFDTIYHEHFCYLSAHAVSVAAARQGLELFDLEELGTHGGSYRYWLAPAGQREVSRRVAEGIAAELAGGLLDAAVHRRFAEQCWQTVGGLQGWLSDQAASGHRVIGYGAAAKGNTLLNAAGVRREQIEVVLDASPEKQGRFLPGTRIPIDSPDRLADLRADEILLLPWNIRDEVARLVAQVCPTSRLWVAVPRMEVVPT